MATVTGITTIKQFPYRNIPDEEFSNTYHFNGNVPADPVAWKSFATSLMAYEKTILDSAVKIVRAYGYDSDDDHAHAVWDYDFLAQGEAVVGAFVPGPDAHASSGDQASMIEWKLDKKNTRGKWIYLRKYMHRPWIQNANVDMLELTYRDALNTFAAALAPDGANFHGGLRPRKYTANITDEWCANTVTTRTLHRRGKRPKAPV
jgi:hypothetical protein